MKKTVLIMAGGKGERFWPKSREKLPKQFLSLTNDGKSMIQHTVDRILPLVNAEDIFIATNKNYKQLVGEQLPQIPEKNILYEPVGKNTAACIGLAAVYMRKRYEDAVMIVLPSDHIIKYTSLFADTLKDACKVAGEEENLVTVGITPTFPETGYGYIKFNSKEKKENSVRVYKVDKFVEKPDLKLAKEYLNSGEYLWNSGMFVWKISSILKNFEKHLPKMYEGLLKIEKSIGKSNEDSILNTVFNGFEPISIDYGIMEKSDDIYILPGTFGWDDVGNWLSMERLNKTDESGNIITGNVLSIGTSNSIILGDKKLIATVGINDIIVVDTDDAVLICDKFSTQDIKKVIENLKLCGRNEYT